MTCEELREIAETLDPLEMTFSKRIEVSNHLDRCQECSAWLHATDDPGEHLTPEELEIYRVLGFHDALVREVRRRQAESN